MPDKSVKTLYLVQARGHNENTDPIRHSECINKLSFA
jgi:hypothetical protein